MNGIVINIDPVFLSIGPFHVYWYSLAIMAAMVVAVLIAIREAGKKGISSNEVFTVAVWSIIGGVIGARAFHVIDHWSEYMADPIRIFQLQGLAIWGGIAVGVGTGLIVARIRRLPALKLLDAAVPALLAAQIIGRFGCIVNGDAYGGVTSLPWGFIYTNPGALIPPSLQGVPTHPYPVYEMLWNGASLLLFLGVRKRLKMDGLLMAGYIGVYSVGRLLLTFVREETQVVFGLQQAQVLAVAGIILAIGLAAFLIARDRMARPAAGTATN